MAQMSLLFPALLLSFLHSSDAQTIIGSSSSFPHLDLPLDSSSPPTKQSVQIWASLPPRGRSDVPIKPTIWDRLTTTNAVQQGQRMTRPTAQSSPSFTSAFSTRNLSSGPVLIKPTASRPRTDTASLESSKSHVKGDATTKGSTPPLPTLSPTTVPTEEGSVKETEDGDPQGLGSGSTPTAMEEESLVPLPTAGDEMAQYRPQAQTAISTILDAKTPPPDRHTVKPDLLVLTTASKISTTPLTETRTALSSVVTQATPRTVALTGEKSNISERMLHDSKGCLGQHLYTMLQMCLFYHF